jgi:RHS repeat-associated protein
VTRYDGRGRASLIEHSRAGGEPESFTAVTSRALRYGPFAGPVAIREVLTDFAGGDGLSSLPRNSTYTYDAAGRVRTATEPEGVIGYEYDLLQGHRRVVSTLPGGQTQGQILDSMGRIHQITLDDQVALTLEWNASGTLASITGRGLAESRSYDLASPHRLTGIDIRREGAPVAAAPLVHLTYLHNFAAAGQPSPWLTVQRFDDGAPDVVSRYFVDAQLRLLRSEEDAVTRTYSWHADGRRDLEEVSAPGVEHSIRHSYDAFGQLEGLTRWTGPNEPAEYTVEVHSDGVGQVTDYADLETGLSRHLVWDAEGHLSTQVLTPAPALGQPASTWAYRYNARDQRVAKVAVGGPVAPTAYLWGAGGLLRESGASTTDYVHGAGMILAAGGTRLAHDHLGSPIASLAQNALNPETGTFDGWGRYFSGAAPNADGGSAPTTHVGYTGHAYDADSDLTYAEARWYDPDIGAFLSRDPVAGSLSEPDTLEPFGYVRGNPLFYVDPDGRVSDEALDAQSEYRTRRHKEMEALRAAKAAARGALFARLPGRLSDGVRNRVVLTLDRVLNDASLADANSLASNPEPTVAAAVGHWSDVEKRALQATDKAADVFLAHWALYSQEGQEGLMQVGKVTTVGPLVVAAPIIAPAATAAAGAAASGHSVYEDVKSGHVGLGTVVNAVLTVAVAAGLVVKAAGLVAEASGAGKVAAPVRVGEASKGGAGGGWKTINEVPGGAVAQHTPTSCGSACGEMISGIEQSTLIRAAGAPTDSATLARALGGRGGYIGPEQLDAVTALGRPFVAHLRDGGRLGHFVVVDGLDDAGRLMIRDPWGGGSSYMMDVDEFHRVWIGEAVFK